MNEDHKNLIALLKIFKNRPYHLAKYLIDNNAFDDDFLNKLKKSERLSKISEKDGDVPFYFSNITHMEDFYNSLLDDVIEMKKIKSIEYITNELNTKLDILIKEEKFEEASKIRDYMFKNGIKRKSKND
jgi:hypothetical protein